MVPLQAGPLSDGSEEQAVPSEVCLHLPLLMGRQVFGVGQVYEEPCCAGTCAGFCADNSHSRRARGGSLEMGHFITFCVGSISVRKGF